MPAGRSTGPQTGRWASSACVHSIWFVQRYSITAGEVAHCLPHLSIRYGSSSSLCTPLHVVSSGYKQDENSTTLHPVSTTALRWLTVPGSLPGRPLPQCGRSPSNWNCSWCCSKVAGNFATRSWGAPITVMARLCAQGSKPSTRQTNQYQPGQAYPMTGQVGCTTHSVVLPAADAAHLSQATTTTHMTAKAARTLELPTPCGCWHNPSTHHAVQACQMRYKLPVSTHNPSKKTAVVLGGPRHRRPDLLGHCLTHGTGVHQLAFEWRPMNTTGSLPSAVRAVQQHPTPSRPPRCLLRRARTL